METKTMETIKGGEFLIRQVKSDTVFISEEFTEEQQMMKESIIEFIDRDIWPNRERFENKDYDFTVECMQKIGDMGLLGISVPEQYGGLGMGFVSTLLVCDFISGSSGSLATAFEIGRAHV